MRAIANSEDGRGHSRKVTFQRVVSVPMRAGPRPVREYSVRGELAPVYRTANTRIPEPSPAVRRRPPRLLTFTLIVAVVVVLVALSTALGRVVAGPEGRLDTQNPAVYGPSIEELIDGPFIQMAPVFERVFKPVRAGVPAPPPVSAAAYILVDLDTGATLAGLEVRRRLSVASLTKIATAMTALRLSDARQLITVSIDAARAEPNRMGILPGEILTVEELLYGLLLDSGNDAAAALAQRLGGEEEFVAAMNELAVESGLTDTHFTNPAGFDGPDNYSSAYDMAVLARRLILEEPLLARIVATADKIIESNHEHGWFGPTNLNRLLTEYPGAFGVKTGRTGGAGYTLIGGAERDGSRLLVVVLGSDNHFDDAEVLLDFGFSIVQTIAAGG